MNLKKVETITDIKEGDSLIITGDTLINDPIKAQIALPKFENFADSCSTKRPLVFIIKKYFYIIVKSLYVGFFLGSYGLLCC